MIDAALTFLGLHPELVLLVCGALAIAFSAWRPDEAGAVWLVALAAGLTASLTLSPLQGEAGELVWGMARDGAAAFFQLTVALALLGSVVLIHYSEPELPHAGRVCGLLALSAAGLCVLSSSVELVPALLGLILTAAPLAPALHAAGGPSFLRGWTLTVPPCTLVALALVLLLSGGDGLGPQRFDLLALPAGAEPDGWLLGASVACGIAGCGLGLFLYGRGCQREAVSPALALWLGALLAGATGLALRAGLGFRFLAGDLEWGSALGVSAAALTLAGHAMALTRTRLRGVVVWLLLAQAPTLVIPLTAPLMSDGHLGPGGQAAAIQLLALLATHTGLLALTLAARGELGDTTFERLRGLGRRNPWLAGFLILLLASAVGLPPTLGFAGKLEVLLAGLRAGLLVTSGLALLAMAVAAWLVLRVVRVLAFEVGVEPEASEPLVTSSGLTVVCAALAVLVLWLGAQPEALIGFTRKLQLLAG